METGCRLVGKVAADNSHKWVFKETPNESDPNLISSWNMSIEPQPRAWEFQFNSGIQTIAIISVREGIVQLGSFDKIVEDLNLVISIQRKFSYLQSIPGIFAIQRPYLPIQHPFIIKPDTHTIENQEIAFSVDDKRQITGVKRLFDQRIDDSPIKSINLGWNSPQNGIPGPPIWSIPPLLPTMSCSLGALLSKLPSPTPSYSNIEALGTFLLSSSNNNNNNSCSSMSQRVKVDDLGVTREGQLVSSSQLDAAREEKPASINPSLNLPDKVVDFGHLREGESALSLN
ncbi:TRANSCRIPTION FACTOR MYC/MYB-RELATED [Salix viminalis]|uniref:TRANSCRIPTION FACTOR MYC/MYB-RELATED n=1 Tax=Salix viminalis TaxID=40686 RepID=A0A9Q0SFV1_SALVM|nr:TRANSCRIPTION FACTOR MYC/MYB-RELATED [Salix viminalis]